MPLPPTPAHRADSLLVGRDEQLRRLTEAVLRAPGVAVVEGEAGIGKTRLVSELLADPRLAGHRILTGAGRRIREPFPLGPILDALRSVGELLDARDLSPVTGALRPLLPELAHRLPPGPEPLDDRAAARHRVFRGLTDLLGALGDTLLVIDDAHWADEQTVDFLGYLLDDAPRGLSVIVTYRSEEADATLRTVTARLPDGLFHVHLGLPPLTADETGALATALLGADRPITDEFAAYLCVRTSGLPFAIRELIALLSERGTLVRRGSGWARRTLDALDVPVGVRDSVLERAGRLSQTARTVAEVAAVLGEPVPLRTLTAASPLTADATADGLTEALAAGLIREQGPQIAYRHSLALQAVYDQMPLPRRQTLHGRAADAVAQQSPVLLGQLAHHLREAHRYDVWSDVAERAADQAAALGDHTEAAQLLEDVLRTADPEPERRGALTDKLGQFAIIARRPPDILDLLQRAQALDVPRDVRGRLHFWTALQYEAAGAAPELLRGALKAAVQNLGDRSEQAAHAMAGLGFPIGTDVPATEHAAWLDRALASAAVLDDPRAATLVRGKTAMQLVLRGDRRWQETADLVLARIDGSPTHPAEGSALYSLGEACLAGHDDFARRVLEIVPDARIGPQAELARRAITLLLDYASGAWQDIDDEAAALLEDLRDRRYMWVAAESVAASLRLARSGSSEVRPRLIEALGTALSANAYEVIPPIVTDLLRLDVLRERPQQGVDDTAEAFRLWELKALWPLAVQSLPALVRALIAADRTAEADRRLRQFAAALRPLRAPLAGAAIQHARGLLTARTGDLAAAARLLDEAARSYDGFPRPYAAAQVREEAARMYLAAGDTAGPARLGEAIAAFEALGAHWDRDRATQLARDHGLTTTSRHRGTRRGYGDGLSPRERQVAELATTGRTNREISEALFLSVRTVEGHLRSVLRKLGLRSRTELAHHLGRTDNNGGARTGAGTHRST